MAEEVTIADLKEQIKKYEAELAVEKAKNYRRRDKIANMSSEVVDTNPYR